MRTESTREERGAPSLLFITNHHAESPVMLNIQDKLELRVYTISDDLALRIMADLARILAGRSK